MKNLKLVWTRCNPGRQYLRGMQHPNDRNPSGLEAFKELKEWDAVTGSYQVDSFDMQYQ